MPTSGGVMKYLYRWANGSTHLSESKIRLEEFFLWGFQTAQYSFGLTRTSPEFIVEAGMIMNKRFSEVRGWHIKTRNGESFQLLYKGKTLKRVIVKRGRGRNVSVPASPHIPRPSSRGQDTL